MNRPTLAMRVQASWTHRGPLTWVLWPLSCLYRTLVALRGWLFRLGWIRSHRLDRPVLVVGNLIAGGAGKTPTTLALVELLRRNGWRPGLVSRGFGRDGGAVTVLTKDATADQVGDEPLLMHRRTQIPVAVGRRRADAAEALLNAHPEIDIILSDDGLQHLRLARDVQVIVFDERGIGNGCLLPAGPLREPFRPGSVPARSLVVYNAPAASTPWNGHVMERRLGRLQPLKDWWEGSASPADGWAELRGTDVIAAAGVANPERFFGMLRARGLQVSGMPLPDHHDFATVPWPDDAAAVIVTEKDAVKLPTTLPSAPRIWVATLDFAFPPGFEAELLRLLPPVRGH